MPEGNPAWRGRYTRTQHMVNIDAAVTRGDAAILAMPRDEPQDKDGYTQWHATL